LYRNYYQYKINNVRLLYTYTGKDHEITSYRRYSSFTLSTIRLSSTFVLLFIALVRCAVKVILPFNPSSSKLALIWIGLKSLFGPSISVGIFSIMDRSCVIAFTL